MYYFDFSYQKVFVALAGVAQWVEGQSANPQVAGWGRARGSRSMCLLNIRVSLPRFLPPLPSL